MKITIYGAGYVGLVTGACFAELGNHVLFVDVDADKVARLQAGICPIHEPDLDHLLQSNLQAGRVAFTQSEAKGAKHGFYQFIAVGTPSQNNGEADLSYVFDVAKTIGKHLTQYCVVITKSTVPVGTAEQVKSLIADGLANRDQKITFDVASNPEFLREGAAVADFMQSNRIIVGTENELATNHLRALYAPFNRNKDRLIAMDIRSAELTKYAANAMLATKISFINEMSNIAERVGADIEQIRIGIGADPRIGYHFIHPGCGFGGSCFPKDLRALEQTANQCGYDAQLIRAVRSVNGYQKQRLFQKIQQHFLGHLQNKVIALWGLSFKPDTDDMREASSRVLMEALWAEGASVRAYDPVAMPETKRLYGERSDLILCQSPEEAVKSADALVVVTEWKVFASPDFVALKSTLHHPVIFDGRNLYDPAYLFSLGFDYYAIGRGKNLEREPIYAHS